MLGWVSVEMKASRWSSAQPIDDTAGTSGVAATRSNETSGRDIPAASGEASIF